jgi:hypothetical protein
MYLTRPLWNTRASDRTAQNGALVGWVYRFTEPHRAFRRLICSSYGHRRIKFFPRSEVMTLEDILYTPFDSLNHAVCLRRLCWGQTMVNAEFAAQRVEPLFASRCTLAQAKETVSERLTVANVARTIGAIIGNSVRMVRQIFNVDMQVTRLIGLEGAVLWLCRFDLQVAQITHPMTTQASIQARA